jgi:hypothetical protein
MSKRPAFQKACLTALCFACILFAQERQTEEILEDSAGSSGQGVLPTTTKDTSASRTVQQAGAKGGHTDAVNADQAGKPARPPFRMFGFGLCLGERIFYPSAINNFIADVYNEMKSGYITEDMGSQDLFMAFALELKFLYNPIPYLGLQPNAGILWAPKYLVLSGAASGSENINLLSYTGGLDFWARVAPFKRVTFKAGLGAVYGASSLSASGDLGDVTLSGSTYGMNVLAGIDLTFRKIAVNIDFLCPIETVTFTSQTGQLKNDATTVGPGYGTTYRYPSSDNLIGLEIHEGVTFLF